MLDCLKDRVCEGGGVRRRGVSRSVRRRGVGRTEDGCEEEGVRRAQ